MTTSIQHKQQIFNHRATTSPVILSTLDLIEYMAAHHAEQASDLAQLAQWHRQQAHALIAERRTLAADVDAALAEAEGLLR